jgi:acyl dehydratase
VQHALEISGAASTFVCDPLAVGNQQHRQEILVPLVVDTPHSLRDWVGREIGVTEWFPVSQDRIQRFAEATEDRQWIHLDRERAQRESPYGTTIAHGFLTLSLLSCFIREVVEIKSGVRMTVNYGLNRVRFPAPVCADSKVRAHFTLRSLRDLPGAVEAVFEAKVEAHGTDKPCCVAEWVIRYYS